MVKNRVVKSRIVQSLREGRGSVVKTKIVESLTVVNSLKTVLHGSQVTYLVIHYRCQVFTPTVFKCKK